MKLVAGLLALMLAIGLVSFWAWRAAPVPPPCDDRVVAESRSPDGKAQAEVIEKRCGDAVSTHVALRLAAAPPQARADVFVAAGGVQVRLSWSGARELVVESRAQRVVREETSWRNVGVRVRLVR